MDDLPPGIGQYDDFHTIDWLRDIARDRTRHRRLVKKKREGCWNKLLSAHDAWSGWVCVLMVGCVTGKSSAAVFSLILNNNNNNNNNYDNFYGALTYRYKGASHATK